MGIHNPASGYDVYTVTDSFEGTLSSKSGSHAVKDPIEIYTAQGFDMAYYVTYPDQEKVSSLYRRECLDVKDKYTVFFGGNHPQLEISTTANNDRKLLIFKDSYANCFVQFLVPYYEKIIMVDARYYYDSIESTITSQSITDILFLYSADTLVKDTSLADVLSADSLSITGGASGLVTEEVPAAFEAAENEAEHSRVESSGSAVPEGSELESSSVLESQLEGT